MMIASLFSATALGRSPSRLNTNNVRFKPLSRVRNDVLGGLVSAAVAIPLAMGYGMFAFASLGENYFADGAPAGIATAFVVAIVGMLLGDKTTTVYAPRVTSTFFLGLLIYGLVHSGGPAIAAGGIPLVLAIVFSIILLAGAVEALFGVLKLGTLIKFAPQPVMAGFQNAAAALLLLVQLGNVCGFDRSVPFTQLPQHLDAIKPLSVAPHLKRTSYQAGTVIFREGDAGNEVLIVTKGTASAYLQMSNTNIRLATFARGTIFGELAILDEGVRSATVVADREVVCFGLTTSNFAVLTAMSPSVAIRLLAAIARELSSRLRTANRTIHQLEI